MTTVSVGTASSNPEYTKQMQNAIKTQDESKIKAAIADIKAKEAATQAPVPAPQPQPQPNPPAAPQTAP